MNPLVCIQNGDVVYTLDGKPIAPELALYSLDPLLLAVSVDRGKVDIAALKHAKDFSRHYLVPMLHAQLEEDLKFNTPKDIKASRLPKNHIALYLELYDQYKTTRQSGYNERRKIIESKVDQWLDAITPEQIKKCSAAANRGADALRKGGQSPEKLRVQLLLESVLEAGSDNKTHLKNWISKDLLGMPEWLQVLTHNSGAYIFTTTNYMDKTDKLGISVTNPSSISATDVLKLYINPRTYWGRINPNWEGPKPKEVLFEELIHELHKKKDSELFLLYAEDEDKYFVKRWREVAKALCHKIDKDPDRSPALKLIKETDPDGGSLMRPGIKEASRSRELLVDIFSTETHLREKGNDKAQVEKRLRAAFGDKVYDASREYVQSWIDDAAKILEKEIGSKEANRYRKKWMDDPFCHDITLTKSSKYKLRDTKETHR